MKNIPILKVLFFLTHSGNEPVRVWLKELSKDNCKIIGGDLKVIQFRWPLGMPLVRKMEPNLWEVRSRLDGGDIARVFFTVDASEMVLLHGFIKNLKRHL